MKEKILKAILRCLMDNGYTIVPILTMDSGVSEGDKEIIGMIKIRAIKGEVKQESLSL